jgi:transposase
MDIHRRAMESLGEVDETVARDQPEWTTPNRVVVGLAALRLRDFSVAQQGRHPALVVAPFALHDAALADLAPGHSLVETLLANGCSRIFLAEWKSATMETRLHTIDTQLSALNVAIDDIGAPVDLIGLCQGGWLSLVYAARFPRKVRRLVLAGAPVDITAAPSALSPASNPINRIIIDELIRLGDGLVRGRYMANLWPRELAESSRVVESLQLAGPPATDAELRYLPPYSPDMNPIEKAFSKLKAFLRKIAERTVAGLMQALEACADIFKPAECEHYFRACGYDTG